MRTLYYSFITCLSIFTVIESFKTYAYYCKSNYKANLNANNPDTDIVSIHENESKLISSFLFKSFQMLSLKFGFYFLPILKKEEQVTPVLAFDDDIFNSYLFSMESTISQGKVYVWKDFIGNKAIELLRSHIDDLLVNNSTKTFSTSGLSNKALNIPSDKQFDKSKDRMVCPISFTNNDNKEAYSGLEIGGELQKKISSVQKGLSILLNRPTLQEEEMYYSVSLPGSSLKLHLDERHEELKGRRGWQMKTRRSLSWLVYLSDEDWDSERQGGQLRSFPQTRTVVGTTSLNGRNISFQSVGAHDGNLQVAWLVISNPPGQSECVQPVFMDCWRQDSSHVGLYLAGAKPLSGEKSSDRLYITRDFSLTNPLTGDREDDWEKHLLPFAQSSTGSNSLLKIEDPALWARGDYPAGSTPVDISPSRGTLVVFDSVRYCVSLSFKC